MGEEKAKEAQAELEVLRRVVAKSRRLEAEIARRQREEAIQFYRPHPLQDRAHRDKARIRAVLGGNRCLHPDQPIYDPVSDTNVAVSEIGGPFHVLAWDGTQVVVAEAEAPFRKEQGPMYTVTLSNGQSFQASDTHLVLSADGTYVQISDLQPGFELFLPQTSSDTGPLAHAEGGQHSWRTLQDSQDDYPACSRSCDAPPPADLDSAQASSPSRSDARERTGLHLSAQEAGIAYGLLGDVGHTEICSHPSSRSDPPSTRDGRDHYEARVFENGFRVFCTPWIRAYLNDLDARLPGDESGHPSQSTAASALWANQFDSSLPSTTSLEVIDIQYSGIDFKWDFTVPGYHNYLCGGVVHHNSGKSHWSCIEAYAHMKGERPWLPKDDPDYKVPVRIPSRILLCGESFGEQIKKVLVPKLIGDPESGIAGIIPRGEIKATKKNQQGVTTFIEHVNGSQIHLQSYDQDAVLFEGTDYDAAAFDEPPPRAIWVAVQRGLTDRGGRSWLAMTPLKEPWIHREIISRDDVSTFVFKTTDNVGYGLKQENVDEFAKNLSEDEKKTRLEGQYFHLQGLVYPGYIRHASVFRKPRASLLAIHPQTKKTFIPGYWGVWMAIDPHPRTPHHAVWVVARPDERLIVCGELRNDDPNNRVSKFAEDILAYEKHFLGVDSREVIRLIDPSSKINNPVDGRSMWDVFAEHGLVCKLGTKKREACIDKMKDLMAYDDEAGVFPTIFFCDDLPIIHEEMTQYIWEDWGTRAQDLKTEKQVPRDKDDHMIECLHRIVHDEPYAVNPADDYDEEDDRPTATQAGWVGY